MTMTSLCTPHDYGDSTLAKVQKLGLERLQGIGVVRVTYVFRGKPSRYCNNLTRRTFPARMSGDPSIGS